MINIFNKIFNFLKILLLFVTFAFTTYILIFMYERLEKNVFGEYFFEFFWVLLPFIILMFLFTINLSARQKSVNSNIFFNVSCTVALLAILFFGYRTLFDQNMVYWGKDGYGINFSYFADQITQIKTMLYVITIADIFLIIFGKLDKKKELTIE